MRNTVVRALSRMGSSVEKWVVGQTYFFFIFTVSRQLPDCFQELLVNAFFYINIGYTVDNISRRQGNHQGSICYSVSSRCHVALLVQPLVLAEINCVQMVLISSPQLALVYTHVGLCVYVSQLFTFYNDAALTFPHFDGNHCCRITGLKHFRARRSQIFPPPFAAVALKRLLATWKTHVSFERVRGKKIYKKLNILFCCFNFFATSLAQFGRTLPCCHVMRLLICLPHATVTKPPSLHLAD